MPSRGGTDGRTEPTHPRWTHVPLGGVLLVAVFDVASVAGLPALGAWLYRAGTFVLMVASVAMVVAIATGLVDGRVPLTLLSGVGSTVTPCSWALWPVQRCWIWRSGV